jgi:hypothetical protein
MPLILQTPTDPGTSSWAELDSFGVADAGVAPSAVLDFPSQPTPGNTLTVGADLYEFQPAAASVTADTNIAVLIGANAAATLTNWIAAVNAITVNNQSASIFRTNGTTPALANGTENVVAGNGFGTQAWLRTSLVPGGDVAPSNPDILLGENITAAGDVWIYGNVNMNTLGGTVAGLRPQCAGTVVVTGAMVAANFIDFYAGFAVEWYLLYVQEAASNTLKWQGTFDTVENLGTGLRVTLDGLGIVADDLLYFRMIGPVAT